MSQKVCYLLTSPEKFQQQHGNGCSNGASPSHTGKKVSAILLPTPASSSELETLPSREESSNDQTPPWRSPSGGTSRRQVYRVLPCRTQVEILHFDGEDTFLWSEIKYLKEPPSNGSPTVIATNMPKSLPRPKLTREAVLSWLKTLSPGTK